MGVVTWGPDSDPKRAAAGHLVGALPNGTKVVFVQPITVVGRHLWRAFGHLRYKEAKCEDRETREAAQSAAEVMVSNFLSDLGVTLTKGDRMKIHEGA